MYTFPNLVHDHMFGVPIGNLPPLTYTFIPNNLKSAEIDPLYMNKFLASEVATGHIDGPFTKDQAHTIFNGHFHTAPLGLIEKPGVRNGFPTRLKSKKVEAEQGITGK